MRNQNIKNINKGFIALMSAVIISAVLMGFLITTNRSTFQARFDALDSEFKHTATGLAESCVNQALLKLAQDYQYDPVNVPVTVDDGTCYIVSTTPHAPRGGNSTNITIKTKGIYKNTFSNYETKATVSNPNLASYVPAPSCYIWTNTNSISSGQSATLGWNSSNATSMHILATNNHAYDLGSVSVPSGSQSITPLASETFIGTATNSIGTTQCTTPSGFLAPSIIVQPPPTCADTVMVLDRTGSMGNTDLTNEGIAAKSLVTLYQNATPQGKVGVGSFGAYPNQSLPAGSASIPVNGQLSFNFSLLTSTINLITGSNSSVGSNLADAITVGDVELGSVRHDPTKAKVYLLVSDGVANQPTGSTPFDTGFKSPSADVQNASGEFWNNSVNAYTDGSGDTNDLVSENDKHRFFNFNFPAIPTGSTITGIEAKVDAWASGSSSTPATSPPLFPTSQDSFDQWTANTGTDVSAVGSSDITDSTYIDTSTSIDTFNIANTNLPAGSTINSVTITAVAKGVPSNSTMQLVTEKNGNLSIGGDISVISGSYKPYTRVLTTDPSTGNPWTLTEVNAWTTSFGVRTTNSANIPRVTQFFVTVSYTPSSNTVFLSLANQSSDTGGNGNGFEINPTGAFIDAGTNASNTNNNGDRHRYFNYGISLPTGASVSGIEVRPDWWLDNTSGTNSVDIELSWNGGTTWTAKKNENTETTSDTNNKVVGSPSDTWGHTWTATDLTNANFRIRITMNSTSNSRDFSLDWIPVKIYYTLAPATSPPLFPTSQDSFDQWTANTGTDVSAVGSSDITDSTYIDTSTSIDTFNIANTNLPAGSTINSVTITAVAKGVPSNSTMQLVTEKNGNLSIGGDISVISGSYKPYTRVLTTDPSTGNPWTLTEVNAWTTSFGVRTTNSANIPRVTQFFVTVSYVAPPALSCQLGMDLSYDNGAHFVPTTEKQLPSPLIDTEKTFILGGTSDTWGRTWGLGDFANNKFIARVHAIDPGSGCSDTAIDHLDWLQIKVHYSQPTNPNTAATTSANIAKANGVDIFTIHFGDTAGRNFLASLASGNSDNDAGSSNAQALIDQENSDGDNFYISPTSLAMTQIFQDIGTKVCPAALAPPTPPTPPTPPAPPPPPPNITIGSWIETP